jgi:hypothetical protein
MNKHATSHLGLSSMTGMMGYSYSNDEGPVMCFNPAKSWQLGWYSDKRVAVNVNDGLFSGTLVGVDDYLSAGNNEYVNIMVENGSEDLFIGFNRNTGINSGTQEAPNKVTVQSQGGGSSNSLLLAELGSGDFYGVSNYLGTEGKLVIKVVTIDTKAAIEIYVQTESCSLDSDCILVGAEECAVGTCGNNDKCSFDTSLCGMIFELTIETDNWPGEMKWDVQDECDNGNVVLSGGPYGTAGATYFQRKNLDPSRYKLTIDDSYGKHSFSGD